MLSWRTIRRPSTGVSQTAVWTVFPCHSISRGRPTFTESNRAIVLVSSQERPKSKHISAGADKPAFDRASNRERETEAHQLHGHDRPEQLLALSISSLLYSLFGRSVAARAHFDF